MIALRVKPTFVDMKRTCLSKVSYADYKMLSSIPNLAPSDKKTVDKALQELPSRLETAKQKEMSEMMGKLKDLGNGILKPFGLSTDNFNFIKDEKSGGYNMQFQQGGSKK